MITTKTSNLIIKKNNKNNYTCSINISVLENEKEIMLKTFSISFYKYCSDIIENFVKEEIEKEIEKIKNDIVDETEMKIKNRTSNK